MPSVEQVGSFQIVIDGSIEENEVHLTLTCRPMIASHDIAKVLDSAAEEIRAGRLKSINFHPLRGDDGGSHSTEAPQL